MSAASVGLLCMRYLAPAPMTAALGIATATAPEKNLIAAVTLCIRQRVGAMRCD